MFKLSDLLLQMHRETDGKLGDKPNVVVEIADEEESAADDDDVVVTSSRRKSTDGGRRKSTSEKDVSTTAEAGKQTKQKKKKESKSLDDMFRKTKAQPAIYWLPLTDEQVCLC